MSQGDINARRLRAGIKDGVDGRDVTHELGPILAALENLHARVAALEARPEPAPPAPPPQTVERVVLVPAEPVALEQQAAAGTMLVEDEVDWRRGKLSTAVDEFAALLIESKFNAQAQDEAAAAVQHAINKQALGLALTEDERAAYDYATSMSAWAEAVEAHARAIKLDLPRLGLDVLRVYRVEDAQWPTMTSGDQAPQ